MPQEPNVSMSGATPPYRLVFKNVSCPENLRYEAVVRANTGYFYSKTSAEELHEELKRFKNIPLINHPPIDQKHQQERLNAMFKRMCIDELPKLSLVPLEDSEFQSLA